MKNVAILLTVFNRKNVTLLGLHSVNKAISKLRGDYQFDIYMTDDGCTDGTSLAVQLEFPNVKIIDCDGTLFWSRGMCAAWEAAISSGIGYDYFLWFNDDVELYANAFQIVFQDSISENDSAIISGAFCNHNNEVSYGGRIGNNLVQPNGKIQEIELMNGNFVLIPRTVYEIVGQIDKRYL